MPVSHKNDATFTIVNLSRGIALTTDLGYSSGKAAIVIDTDLQDPLELIPSLIERWREDNADRFRSASIARRRAAPQSMAFIPDPQCG